MSKTADCPRCKAHNCVSDYVDLNYCMWCGYSFKEEREKKQLKTDDKGQIKLF